MIVEKPTNRLSQSNKILKSANNLIMQFWSECMADLKVHIHIQQKLENLKNQFLTMFHSSPVGTYSKHKFAIMLYPLAIPSWHLPALTIGNSEVCFS